MDPQEQPNQDFSPQPQEEKSAGPAIGIIIIILVILLGGLYFWGQRAEQQEIPQLETEEQMSEVDTLRTQSDSDEVTSIESDLNASDFDNLGNEMSEIEAEAGASGEM